LIAATCTAVAMNTPVRAPTATVPAPVRPVA
jgi:hypothetical protein